MIYYLQLANTDGTTTYAWTNDNPDIGLDPNGNGDILSFTATNNTTSALVATIEVTPTYENGGVTCAGNPETFTITVNPGAQVGSVADQVLCVGELTNDILFTTPIQMVQLLMNGLMIIQLLV